MLTTQIQQININLTIGYYLWISYAGHANEKASPSEI